MQDLNVTFVQTEIHWEDIDANLQMFTEKIGKIEEGSDLIVIPEMFSTGFSTRSAELSEEMGGKAMRWMEQTAAQKNAVITGSIMTKEKGEHYNRLVWMRPDGSFEIYDKRHLFRMMDEDQYYSAGDKRLVAELKGWRVCPLVCYDLRFPVWSRNCDDYDVLIYTANWPEVRRFAWSSLLVARAIENQCYVIGVNRIGVDGNEIQFPGDSVVIDCKGTVISKMQPYEDAVETVTLSWAEIAEWREKFPVNLDADDFQIN